MGLRHRNTVSFPCSMSLLHIFILGLSFCSGLSAQEGRVSFANFHVLEVTATTEADLALLGDMEATAATATAGALEFWQRPPTRIGHNTTLSVHPDLVGPLRKFFDDNNIGHRVLVNDLQSLIDQESIQLQQEEDEDGLTVRDPSVSYYNSSSYNTLNQISMRLRELQSSNPNLVEIHSIGTTHEGRAIEMVTVAVKDTKQRAAVLLECGMHAREWISPAFCMYTLQRLLEKESTMLTKFDIHMVPVANPDGYEYSWRTNRMWRKNRKAEISDDDQQVLTPAVEEENLRSNQLWNQISWQSPKHEGGCQVRNGYGPGTDANRNFDIAFSKEGASKNQCAENYHGPSAFSEAESVAIRDAIENITSTQKLAAFLSVHAYSQLWMFPHGHTATPAKDHADLERVAEIATAALSEEFGTVYKVGPIHSTIRYLASGNSVDWAYERGVKYSYAMELRDKGFSGFLLPPELIEPTNKETFAGLTALMRELEMEY